MCTWHGFSSFYQRAYGGWRGVKNTNFMLCYHLPKTASVRVSGDSFKNNLRCAHRQWAVSHIGVASNPAHVSRTPKYIIIFDVERPAHGVKRMQQIACRAVLHALWLAC